MRFVVDKLAQGPVLLFGFLPVNIIPPWISIVMYHLCDEPWALGGCIDTSNRKLLQLIDMSNRMLLQLMDTIDRKLLEFIDTSNRKLLEFIDTSN
jgi:hypothetical protein